MRKALEKDGLRSSEAMGALGRITSLKDLPDEKTLLAYMRQAAELLDTGERTKSIDRPKKSAPKPVRVPAELVAALKKNKAATRAFAAFPPGHRREYADWIAEARRPETKQKTRRSGRHVDRPGQIPQLEIPKLLAL
jgi:uncharacterized protein YdeI (YjbR/CyaY-like superfamily)